MFQYQIEDMRKTVDKLLARKPPPEVVLIKRDHAEHLGVDFHYVDAVNEVRPSGLSMGIPYGSVVRVKVYELYLKLKQARGIDADDYEVSQRERASSDSGRQEDPEPGDRQATA